MITVEQFKKYATGNKRAHYSRIPIVELESFRTAFAKYGVFYRVRYRGPRFNTPSARYRNMMAKQASCLKQDATHFSVYPY